MMASRLQITLAGEYERHGTTHKSDTNLDCGTLRSQHIRGSWDATNNIGYGSVGRITNPAGARSVR